MNKYQPILPNTNNSSSINYTANIIKDNPTLYNGDNNKLQIILRELKKREYQKKIKKNIHSIQNIKNDNNDNKSISKINHINNNNNNNNININNIDYIVPKYSSFYLNNNYINGYNNINNNYIKYTFLNNEINNNNNKNNNNNNINNNNINNNNNKENDGNNKIKEDNIVLNQNYKNNDGILKSVKVSKSQIKSFSFINKSLPPLPNKKTNNEEDNDSVVPTLYKSINEIKQTSELIYLVPKYSSSFRLPSIEQLTTNNNSSLDLPPISRNIIE